jgi:PBP1b-binding outer membrane lipoprotein LpoB
MKRIVAILLIMFVLVSCSQGITVQQAANGKARCGRHLR